VAPNVMHLKVAAPSRTTLGLRRVEVFMLLRMCKSEIPSRVEAFQQIWWIS